MSMLNTIVKKIFKSLNLHVTHYPEHCLRSRIKLLRHHEVNTIIDIGANTGQFALEIRELGFKGKIISFEPLYDAYRILEKNASTDTNWTSHNFAIGNSIGQIEINVASNLASSSILPMLKEHQAAAPSVHYTKTEKIEIKTLNSIWASHIQQESPNYYLKIDTQGFEKEVLQGAEGVLDNIKGIQLEMSLIPLYQGEWLYEKIYDYLRSKGFSLYSIEPQLYNNNTGQLLQMDGIFYK